MKKYKIEFEYLGIKTTVDLRRVVAVSRPKSGKFLIYFENAVWSVNECEFENVYNAWMALWHVRIVSFGGASPMQTDIAHVFGLPSHVNKHGVTRQSKSVTRKNLKCMAKVLSKCGFSGFNGQSWYTYLLFGCLWVHINKHFRWPLVSFVRLPF